MGHICPTPPDSPFIVAPRNADNWTGSVSRAGRNMSQPQRIGRDMAERKVLTDISEYGWHCMNIVEDDGHPPWSFTIGFYETWQLPELIIIGRSRATAHEMLSQIAARSGSPPRSRRHRPLFTPRHRLPIRRSLRSPLFRLRRLRPLVLPRQTLPALSTGLAIKRRPLSVAS
jgi:Domain of unknown function (DUF4262)